MSRRSGLLWFLALAAFFLAFNHEAYRGFFQGDEIDNVNWTRLVQPHDYVLSLLSPRFQANNFRPVGHFYFREAGIYFDLSFWKFVATIHLFHLFNVWLVWLLARRMGAPPVGAGAACFVFAMHAAFFDAVWMPMYVFDVLCATFCLLSVLWYAQRRWVLSFLAFWLAYKAKELAVMLPLALAFYELWFGDRKWLRLAPFLAVSLSFGLQGILLNPNRDNDYTFRFSLEALGRTSWFYASQALMLPFAGFLLPVAALFARNRRAWFGVAMMTLLFIPLLFLPGRMFAAYCYVPFTGLAIAFSGFAEAAGNVATCLFFAIVFPLNPPSLDLQRYQTLDRDAAAKEWLESVQRFARTKPNLGTLTFRQGPQGYSPTACKSAIQYVFDDGGLVVYSVAAPDLASKPRSSRTALLDWDAKKRTMSITVTQP